MANKHYDEFCEAFLPNLKPLDRQLLGHLSARYNETKSPPRAYPSLDELKRITGVHEKSISRSFGRLVKQGYIFRITKARKGWQSEWGLNMPLIRTHKVTDELPIDNKQVTEKSVIGNPTVLYGSPESYPKPIKPIKPTTQLVTDLLSVIPKDKQFNVTPEFVSMIEQLKQHGTSYSDLKGDLKVLNWFSIHTPREFVIHLIKEKLAKPPRYSSEVKPKWCGNCDEETRKLNEWVDVPNGNGSKTQSCLVCNPYLVNKANGY
jgi:thiol-disulfide isomerase/thioredoxin